MHPSLANPFLNSAHGLDTRTEPAKPSLPACTISHADAGDLAGTIHSFARRGTSSLPPPLERVSPR